MADEFQESEIIFSNLAEDHRNYFTLRRDSRNSSSRNNKTLPVSIPGNMSRFVEFEEMEFDDRDITPPHLIVRRRIAGKMAFSVCSGNGRTLKGRDLSQVRNSILRLTGFLET